MTAAKQRTENDVEYDCISWLQAKGWTAERNPVGMLYTRDGRPHPVGRPGACDWRLKRSTAYRVHYFELEAKAPGKTPDPRQRQYMAAMTHLGVLTTWADSLEMLKRWYAEVIHDAASAA